MYRTGNDWRFEVLDLAEFEHDVARVYDPPLFVLADEYNLGSYPGGYTLQELQYEWMPNATWSASGSQLLFDSGIAGGVVWEVPYRTIALRLSIPENTVVDVRMRRNNIRLGTGRETVFGGFGIANYGNSYSTDQMLVGEYLYLQGTSELPVLFIRGDYPQDQISYADVTIEIQQGGVWTPFFDVYKLISELPLDYHPLATGERVFELMTEKDRFVLTNTGRVNCNLVLQLEINGDTTGLPIEALVGRQWAFSNTCDHSVFFDAGMPVRDLLGRVFVDTHVVKIPSEEHSGNVTFTVVPSHLSPTGYALACHGIFKLVEKANGLT